MGLLVMLCYRSDYDAHFYHAKGVNYVPAGVKDLLSIDNDGNKSEGLSALCVGQEFSNLICHLAVHARVRMNILHQPLIDLVSEWCRLHLQRGIIDGQVMPYLLSAVANLLETHIEQAIKVLSEQGRHLLNNSKHSYRSAKHIGGDKLNKYFFRPL